MAYCKKCAYPIFWKKISGRWVPLNENGNDHRDNCVPNPNVDKIINVLKKPDKLQIGENEYI